MVTLAIVEGQLKRLGCNFHFWGRAEVKELANILLPQEIITACVYGRYEGGFGLLTVTNLRLLLVDRKFMFLMLEDIRFDMVAELDFSSRLFDSTIRVVTPSRTLAFQAWNNQRLRAMLNYLQQRVMETRQPQLVQQFQPLFKHQQTQAPVVGGLAMRASAAYRERFNPYTQVPFLLRRGTIPRFY